LGVTEWLTPSGKSIWHVGLTPDIAVSLASGVAPLTPDSETNLTLEQIQASGDQQLLTALNLLQ
jgi:C-terminal processing protease CtpA/Prc